MKKQTFIAFLIFFLFGSLIWLAINSFANYVDVTGFCRIEIKGDMLRGNEDTIKRALSLIKRTDTLVYSDVCRNVETITERYCVDADYHLDQAAVQASWERPGCYVRGSKTIYLKPETDLSESVVEARAKEIVREAMFSKGYWETLK